VIRTFALGLSVVFGTVIALPAFAGNFNYIAPGPASSVGAISNSEISTSGRYNPSATFGSTKFSRFPLLDFTGNVQTRGLGEFNTVFEDMEDRLDSIDSTFTAFEDGDATVGDVLGEINDLETALDTNIALLADNFYAKPGAMVHMPFTPLDLNFQQAGTFSFGVSSLTQGRISLLHDEIKFNVDAQKIIDANDNDEDLDLPDFLRTTSSIYLKQAQVFNLDLGYARQLPPITFLDNFGVSATAGARGTLIAHSLQKRLYPLKSLIQDADSGDDSLQQTIQDDLTSAYNNYNYDVALDLGITLTRDNTQLGFTLYNVNRPVMEYNVLGGVCGDLTDDTEQTECYHAEHFASLGDISLAEEHRVYPHLGIEASQSWLNNRLVLASSLDVTQKTDLFGEESQTVNLAFLAQPTQWYWPRLRLGVGKDFTDLEATQLGFGLSFFKVFQLDSSLNADLGDLFSDDLTEQGNALRSASASASFNIAF